MCQKIIDKKNQETSRNSDKKLLGNSNGEAGRVHTDLYRVTTEDGPGLDDDIKKL